MKKLTYTETDLLKEYTAEKIKEVSLEELEKEYLSNPTFKEHKPAKVEPEQGSASRTRRR